MIKLFVYEDGTSCGRDLFTQHSFYVSYKYGKKYTNCKDVPQGFEKPEQVNCRTPPEMWTELAHTPVL